ncbi:hypothetical protein I5M32_11235 [Pedobacter sp. SD-b]|uniref:DUF4359 domain-containing protein n=1 Tax=Pedobacter segetis TaxID=2793069 RepID=A0ABS1BKW2_9SPHI|nr:hypothetical protein [Pedobacter segetis]MBK0383530.1 hypothetical protein [Pedobacter segetis]
MKNKGLIFGLVAGVGLLVFFFIKKSKAALKQSEAPPQNPATATIAQKIATGYNANATTLNSSEVKRYAGWIDAINDDVLAQKSKKSIDATAKMIYNANLIKSLSDANLKSVIGFWEKARGIKITQSVFFVGPILDNTETIPAFIRRIKDL